MSTITELLAEWDSGIGKPYKGNLINKDAYTKNPNDISCMCAQGQALYRLGGWSAKKLMSAKQVEADKAVADIFGISCAHSALLRIVNDSVDGAPSIVITNPAAVLGEQADVLLAFWRHLDRMTPQQWAAARTAELVAGWVSAEESARDAAGESAGVSARESARDAARATWPAAQTAVQAAAWASNEIQGAAILRDRGIPFFFLLLFGFDSPEAVMVADAEGCN